MRQKCEWCDGTGLPVTGDGYEFSAGNVRAGVRGFGPADKRAAANNCHREL